ncbi:OmpA family protein [Roseinatronobacter alkalisoli]|uniref:OmpA family protein n=1 Tax=Roseinatronobacter alkalisoli TaxID=3028235 RepID=A0ABT5TCN1_9RHOB|nr:OmpA family protein [Roseinatronobacter sp. HJB301]MDD7972877.1 OmpA family protein [Roseinatronobacter sp. HJB301]
MTPHRARWQAGLMALSMALLPFMAAAQDVDQSADSVEDIVQALIATADLGAARAVCIGTPQDCAPAPLAGLDMRVGFEFDSDRLTPQAQDALGVFATALRDARLKAADFRIEGHTDAHGTETYNLELSQRRAAAVHDFLHAQGIDPLRLEAVGLGQSQPRLPDPYDSDNRRVELRAILRQTPD